MEQVAAGDFTAQERFDIDRAIRAAEQACRYEFSVFVGTAEADTQAFARRLHAALSAPTRSVLIMVDPHARAIEVVTGEQVRRTLSDAEATLAVLAMQSAFAEGDAVGGIKRGISMLALHAVSPQTLHAAE